MNDRKVSVMLVDDHPIYSAGVSSIIEKNISYLVKMAGTFTSGTEFMALIATGHVPELLLLDIRMPDVSGVEIARQMKESYPMVKIIMISSDVSEELIDELLDIGVEGYLSKLADENDIVTAVRTVINGGQYFGRCVSKIMYELYLTRKRQEAASPKKRFPLFAKKTGSETVHLTAQEENVIRLLCDGLTAKEIADRLNVSTRTIESHKSKIMSKLGFSRTSDLIKYVIHSGIVKLNLT
ncbi:response regulator transcription factor [Tannerella forsythia]|uniref:DNA-binding response regulator n=1 Tax=Tannerella forsythia TaxID=28112 RepID=A0A3P1YJG6_TANFO|nr:response regulator transcription factor [Tannerella forsythia]RRD70688.1 DNA-binding response regulator [Tannerella forsythia]